MKRRHHRVLVAVSALAGAVLGGVTYLGATHSQPSPPTQDACQAGRYCVLNPAVTQDTIKNTICVRGWTATVRPTTSYTEPLKLQQIAAEGLPGGSADYEEDHRMPLELGGDPRAVHNLSPEAHPGSSAKDSAENQARTEVCNAGQPLALVQLKFVATWLADYPGYK